MYFFAIFYHPYDRTTPLEAYLVAFVLPPHYARVLTRIRRGVKDINAVL
jgi:hypothetical protein